MPQYRLYRRDAAGRILTAPEVITAEGDRQATCTARETHAVPCEVWHEKRLVAVIDEP